MGLLRRAWSPSSLAKPEKWLVDGYGGPETAAGVRVNEDTAKYYSAFFAGINTIASDVGLLPLPLYRRLERGKERAVDHPLFDVLHGRPNPLMSTMSFRRTLTSHAITWGDGWAYIVSDGAGRVVELWPLHPGRIHLDPALSGSDGRGRLRLFYRYTDPDLGIDTILRPDEVLHVAGLGDDGIHGYSVVELARNSIGLGLATEAYGSKFFGNGSRPGGVLRKKEGKLSAQAKKRVQKDWERMHRGLDAAQRVAILEEGLEWQSIGIPNNDAQFLETRKLQVGEVARWLRLPPHKIGDLDRATFSNIESQQIDYVTSTLMSWLVTWEQAISLTLLTPRERRAGLFAEHIVDALLRGDTKSRMEAYAIGRQWGWWSANDVREKENENPVDGGDLYLTPMNMIPADQAADPDRAAVRRRHARVLAGRSAAMRRRIADSFKPLIVDADERIARLEEAEVASLARRHLDEDGRAKGRDLATFLTALGELYRGRITDRAFNAWIPIFTSFTEQVAADAADDVAAEDAPDLSRWIEAYVTSHIAYHTGAAVGQITSVAQAAAEEGLDVGEAILALLSHWIEVRPERTATWETNQLVNAAARETWKAAGVSRLRWVTVGETCPYCTSFDGRIAPIDGTFASAGSQVVVDDADSPLRVEVDMHHPPLHPGCDCVVEPA